MRQQKRLEIRYSPLRTSCSIEVVGTVPAKQIYQGDKREYTPDYTVAPLVIFPRCNAINTDDDIQIDGINEKLTNLKWQETISGVTRLITSSTDGYSITLVGADKGMLKINRNFEASSPVTLSFSANFIDERTGQAYAFRQSILIQCIDGTAAIPALSIDAPASMVFNPAKKINPIQTLTARVFAGDMEVTDKCRYRWYKSTPSSLAECIITDEDIEVVSIDGKTISIDLRYVSESTYICKASYSPDGDAPEEPLPYLNASVTIKRRIPQFECNWEGVPIALNDKVSYIYPRPIVSDANDVLPISDDCEFKFTWYVKRAPSIPYKVVSNEINPEIEFTDKMMLMLDVDDRGALVPVCDGDTVICDGDSVVVSRVND